MRRRCFERLLVVLICARVIAGCTAASQPSPGSPNAATTATMTSSAAHAVSATLDLCRLPDLAPASVLSRLGYTQLAVSLTDPNGAPIGGLKEANFTVRSGPNSFPIVYFREESGLTTPVSLVIVGDVSESMYRKTVVSSADDLAKVRTALNRAGEQLNECDEAALVMIGGNLPDRRSAASRGRNPRTAIHHRSLASAAKNVFGDAVRREATLGRHPGGT